MKAKKLICIILCFVLAFTLLSGPWRAEAEAAGTSAIILAIVGTFIVSAGFSFATRGELQAATDAFMKSDCAKYLTWLNNFSMTAANGVFDLAKLIATNDFAPFMKAIYDYFGKGNVEVDNGTPAPSEGMAYYNGVLLPTYTDNPNFNFTIALNRDNGNYYLFRWAKVGKLYYTDNNTFYYEDASYRVYELLNTDNIYSWKSNLEAGGSNSIGYFYYISGISRQFYGELIWSSVDIPYSDYSGVFSGSDIKTEGEEAIDNIPVVQDPTYGINDIIEGWTKRAEEGSIEWQLDSLTVFEDVTSPDKTAPMTSTQTGVLTEAGVKVESIAQTMEEYRTPGLTSVFPFCIPFDIYNFLSILTAEREAPHFDFNLDFGALGSHSISVDLSEWETVATILRTIELLAFCIGLAFATSKVIKW